jgi:hypothetical protein
LTKRESVRAEVADAADARRRRARGDSVKVKSSWDVKRPRLVAVQPTPEVAKDVAEPLTSVNLHKAETSRSALASGETAAPAKPLQRSEVRRDDSF